MKLFSALKSYRFELKHLLILFLVIAIFQIILSFIHNASTSDLLAKTLDLYRRDSAERIADLTTASLEFLLEQRIARPPQQLEELQGLEQKFNIILSQQVLQKNVEQVFIIYEHDDHSHIISNGQDLISVIFRGLEPTGSMDIADQRIFNLYNQKAVSLSESEQIFSFLEGDNTFHIFVPFVPQGEYSGVVYMRIAPDFSNLAEQISITYSETAALFSALILLGLLAMFYISSFTVKERDDAQKQLFAVRERQMRRQIEHEKEALFTRRIYHTHHKAEKIMGFIKEDLRLMATDNLDKIRFRVSKYANFISRAIYDMKAFDPPLQVIRNPIFRSDLNSIIRFIVDHIFRRVYREGVNQKYQLELDPNLPLVPINEYVIWEILEPLIQNSIDHNSNQPVIVRVGTVFDVESKTIRVSIEDNGNSFNEEMLQVAENGIKKLFLEDTTSKEQAQNAGYGCYIAYANCKRCGWELDAEISDDGGAKFIITISS